MINYLIGQFKQSIVKAVNESQLPPAIISACLGEIKGNVDLQAELAVAKEIVEMNKNNTERAEADDTKN